jgi:hypothetical protein
MVEEATKQPWLTAKTIFFGVLTVAVALFSIVASWIKVLEYNETPRVRFDVRSHLATFTIPTALWQAYDPENSKRPDDRLSEMQFAATNLNLTEPITYMSVGIRNNGNLSADVTLNTQGYGLCKTKYSGNRPMVVQKYKHEINLGELKIADDCDIELWEQPDRSPAYGQSVLLTYKNGSQRVQFPVSTHETSTAVVVVVMCFLLALPLVAIIVGVFLWRKEDAKMRLLRLTAEQNAARLDAIEGKSRPPLLSSGGTG